MYKLISLLALLISLNIFAQDGITVIDEHTGEPMLLGRHDREAFSDSSFSWWFNEEYEYYSVDDSALVSVKDRLEDINVTVVMGTWCSDSQREVPRFYKILDYLEFNESNIDLICVDRAKAGVADEVDGLNIKLVPTFIFYKDGKELGRIVETPEATLEKDLANILK